MRRATAGVDPGWRMAVAASLVWAVGLTGLGALLHRRFNRVFTDLL
jgi:hypothetical protein